jgi:CBS domain containing-hemolysin-like protein
MMAAMIFVISILTLLQFFVSYSRSLIAESRGHELSEQAREICGLTAKTAAGDQFRRLSELIALCPESGSDGSTLLVVSAYFHLLDGLRHLSGWTIPSAKAWIESERGGCAYAAAVVLDRRIAYNRMIMAQQTSRSI